MRPLLLCLALSLLPLPAVASDAILVFTRTAKFRHESIPVAVQTLRQLAGEQGLRVDHGEDPAAFTPANLGRYRAVVFANTTGDVLDTPQQDALQAFVEQGGGFMGLHAAADTEYDWPWYGELIGAWFHKHPPGLQTAQVSEKGQHGASRQWTLTDEIYNYRRNPRPWVQVLATVDEASYEGGTMGADHPITWCRPMQQGRSWYTGFGHDEAVFADANVRALLRRGLAYASGASPDC
ncbi:ThuA domain-containing protein [Stenotrophomonas sp. C3(2023)]|uniref:ThuA domain-containing protein n=1 Tax=Stenotrophomonas sp. C3(2023) TaxID=3080277 RepID=UPI00293C823D|nr:ThuA domain-containing protein [Stenotrophomonas sp. C3(2023)]MDV3470122.1 ThuA domain-containing protein [Stenotrophomonas sp. C3(2023)]